MTHLFAITADNSNAIQALNPSFTLKDGLLVRSQLFKYHQAIGDPVPTIKRLSDWGADEIVLLNIGTSSVLDSRRDDKWHSIGLTDLPGLVRSVSSFCFAPLSVGGGIRTLEHFSELFQAGADKCIVNTTLFDSPGLVREAVAKYGSQAIVASLDAYRRSNSGFGVKTASAKREVNMNLRECIEYVADLGVGEILLSSIDKDGSALGYELDLLAEIPTVFPLPIVINSGPGTVEHFAKVISDNTVSAAAASNIFYFTELSYPNIKKSLISSGYNIREFDLSSPYIQREASYDDTRRRELIQKLEPEVYVDYARYKGHLKQDIRYCTRCLYPSLSAAPMQFDQKGVCMGCRTSEAKLSLTADDYQQRGSQLRELLYTRKSQAGYDCIVSVSGGKDSYYQTHYVIHELGLKPLLVTYNGNNYTEAGWRNLLRMRHVFDCDHIIVSPSVSILRKLNRLAFAAMGDMNWHAHMGIFTTAPRIAVQQEIPFVFGENTVTPTCVGSFRCKTILK